MSMDPNKWINTIPFIGTKFNQEKYKLDSNRWVNTLPRKDDSTLILKDEILKGNDALILSNVISINSNSNSNSNSKSRPVKKYSLTIIIFVVGLILVSVIKNGTRNLQKEINNLQASINSLQIDIHQTTLDHFFITSPENISRLAEEHLEPDFVPYKQSQIKLLNKEIKNQKTFKKKSNGLSKKAKLEIAKKIDGKKTELRKLQELYSRPEKVPGELKIQVVKKIEKTKNELKKLYSNPKDSVDLSKTRRWAVLQFVKAFLGIPVVPGR